MLVARILYPVHALGPSNRIAIWMCGCKRNCPACANPELQAFDMTRDVAPDVLADLVTSLATSHHVSGLTITGGEPFEQSDQLLSFLSIVHSYFTDILVFTGYTLSELEKQNDEHTKKVIDMIDVLIDGEYIDEQNNGSTLRGSDNQTIHIFKDTLQPVYDSYISKGRQFENFETSEGIIAVGLHYKGFMQHLTEQLSKKLK